VTLRRVVPPSAGDAHTIPPVLPTFAWLAGRNVRCRPAVPAGSHRDIRASLYMLAVADGDWASYAAPWLCLPPDAAAAQFLPLPFRTFGCNCGVTYELWSLPSALTRTLLLHGRRKTHYRTTHAHHFPAFFSERHDRLPWRVYLPFSFVWDMDGLGEWASGVCLAGRGSYGATAILRILTSILPPCRLSPPAAALYASHFE